MRLFILIFICANSFCFSQDSIAFRKNYKILEDKISIDIKSHLQNDVITIDSLVPINGNANLNFLKEFHFLSNSALTKQYKRHALRCNSQLVIKQWEVPISIYFDKKISKKDIKQFKIYLEDFKNINNLTINVTENLEDANFYFKVFDKAITGLPKDTIKNSTKEELANDIFYRITYNLVTNNNNKFNCGVMKISKSELLKPDFLSKLKTIFYLSLTQFCRSQYAEKNSILNYNSSNVAELSDYDIVLLKYHYHYIYPFKVNLKTFNTLIQTKKNQE